MTVSRQDSDLFDVRRRDDGSFEVLTSKVIGLHGGERWDPWATTYVRNRLLPINPRENADMTIAEALIAEGWVEPQDASSTTTDRVRGVGNGPVAGRFVLLHLFPGHEGFVTSWDTWDEAEVAFPIVDGFRLRDDETGRVWHAGSPYEWEAAQT